MVGPFLYNQRDLRHHKQKNKKRGICFSSKFKASRFSGPFTPKAFIFFLGAENLLNRFRIAVLYHLMILNCQILDALF